MKSVIKTRLTFTYPLSMIIFIFMVLAAHTFAQVGDGFAITRGPGSRSFASAAFDGTNYMVAWGNRTLLGVYVTRVTPDGVVLDPDGIVVSNSGRFSSDTSHIAFDGTNYLVVWHQGTPETVFGLRVSPEGRILDEGGFQISRPLEGISQSVPAVTFSGTNYFVVWHRSDNRVVGTRISPARDVLDPDGIIIGAMDQPTTNPRPSIASNVQDFLAVWHVGPFGNEFVEGARVSNQGKVMDADGIVIAAPDQAVPSIAHDLVNYFVVWEDRSNGLSQSDIVGARINVNGLILDKPPISISAAPRAQYLPFVDFDGESYLVTWTDIRNPPLNEIWGTRVTTEGIVQSPDGLQLSAGPNHRFGRGLTLSGPSAFLLWEESDDMGQRQIYGLLSTY